MPAIDIDIDKDKLRDFCRRWKITELALFGSVTRPDEFRPDSDVDVLERSGVERMRNYLQRNAILETAVLLDVV